MRTLKTWAAAAAMVVLTGASQAALVSLGDGTVKDTNTNLIWLQDWNVNGKANWSTQMAWAEGLDFADSTDWVLPDLSDYSALLVAYGHLDKVAAFTNVQMDYWSSTVIDGLAWEVGTYGIAGTTSKFQLLYAVAVRRDDVTTSVPEPQTLALALLALGATVVARRRRSHRGFDASSPLTLSGVWGR